MGRQATVFGVMTCADGTLGRYNAGRTHFAELLDAAHEGRPAIVRRDTARVAVVDVERLRVTLAGSLRWRAQVVAEAGGFSVFVPGVPVAADGPTFDDAITSMVEVLREYAEDWQDRLREAPNHRDNWALVQLICLSDDAQLRVWLTGGPGIAAHPSSRGRRS
ncbi:MAG: hypothetical protein JXA67_04555 [Micromonosporaceae bacterium]|nr:hypothetical protein [Micromonosporaceae bacterium]